MRECSRGAHQPSLYCKLEKGKSFYGRASEEVFFFSFLLQRRDKKRTPGVFLALLSFPSFRLKESYNKWHGNITARSFRNHQRGNMHKEGVVRPTTLAPPTLLCDAIMRISFSLVQIVHDPTLHFAVTRPGHETLNSRMPFRDCFAAPLWT